VKGNKGTEIDILKQKREIVELRIVVQRRNVQAIEGTDIKLPQINIKIFTEKLSK
jgi:hypothetical protein